MGFVNYSFTALKDTDPTGINVIGSQSVEVFNAHDGVTYATIYSDEGVTPIAQPGAATDPTSGVLEFWILPGYYIIESGTRTENVLIDDGSRLKVAQMSDITSATRIIHYKIGEFVDFVERTYGNGGGGRVEIVDATTVTENELNIVTGDATRSLSQLPPTSVFKENILVRIPTDFATLQSAVDFYQGATCSDDFVIELQIESGHLLTGGIGVFGGSYSHFKITSADYEAFVATAGQTVFNLAKAYALGNYEVYTVINGSPSNAFTETSTTSITLNSGATLNDDVRVYYSVKLDAGFVGVDTSTVPTGIIGTETLKPLFMGFNCRFPWLDCRIDMNNLHGTGWQMLESDGVVSVLSGVVNAGYRGAEVHGNANLYLSIFSGANGSGLRMQQASRVNARSGIYDDCCKTSEESAVYVSRASNLEFRGGSAQGSGSSGMIVRRSKVNADDANFDGAGDKAIEVESASEVSFSNGSALNSTSTSLRCTAGGFLYAVGVASSTTTSALNIDVDGGSTIVIAGSNVIEGSSGESQAVTESNVDCLNCFDNQGMLFYVGATQDNIPLKTTTAGITADVSSVQGGGQLNSAVNEISICANIGDAVTLPFARAGNSVIVINNGANACDVFPASNDKLDALAINIAASLAAGASIKYTAFNSQSWVSI